MDYGLFLAQNTMQVDNCLLWVGKTKRSGNRLRYVARVNGVDTTAQRFAYFVHRGLPPDTPMKDSVVAICGNPSCCAIGHLVAVPHGAARRTVAEASGPTLGEYLRQHSSVDQVTGCWEWDGAIMHDGYGRAKYRGRSMRAHRMAYASACGLTLDEMAKENGQVLHKCNNRRCCNPAHLYLGSHADNMVDKANAGSAKRVSGGAARLSPAQVHALKQDYAAGMSMVALAAKYGVSKPAVSNRLRDCKRAPIMTHRKLTDDQVRAVYAEAYSGKGGVHDICAAHGISLSSLRERARKLGLL